MSMTAVCERNFLSLYGTGNILCSGLEGRRPFWLLNPPARGVPSLFLLDFSFSGDEEVE